MKEFLLSSLPSFIMFFQYAHADQTGKELAMELCKRRMRASNIYGQGRNQMSCMRTVIKLQFYGLSSC